VGVVNSLADVKGTLCVEAAYPTAMQFVQRSARRPPSIVTMTVEECFAALQAGTVGAVLTDRPVLAWFVSNYGLTGTFVSPVLAANPFSFVYPAGSQLRQYVVRMYAAMDARARERCLVAPLLLT
jgi:ABC-type amino acid transport substrate-binding protein